MMSEIEVPRIFNLATQEKENHIFVLNSFIPSYLLIYQLLPSVVYSLPLMIATLDHHDVIVTKGKKLLSTAFKDVIIYSSGISIHEKLELKKMLKLMNGHLADFLEDATHLVVKSVKAEKYQEAMDLKIPIFHIDWIKNVYQVTSITANGCIKATSNIFDKFHLKIFTGLKIFLHGLDLDQHKKIDDLIYINGGSLMERYCDDIDVMIVQSNSVANDPVKRSKLLKIPIIVPKWVEDSVMVDRAKRYDEYLAENVRNVQNVLSYAESEESGQTSEENFQHNHPSKSSTRKRIFPFVKNPQSRSKKKRT